MTWRQCNDRCVRVKSARIGESYMRELLVFFSFFFLQLSIRFTVAVTLEYGKFLSLKYEDFI